MRSVNSAAAADVPNPLGSFVGLVLGLPGWNVKQGYGSFLTFEFGEPTLKVEEYQSGSRRSAHVRGQWHLWIYCCHWRALQHGAQLASSEDSEKIIGQATAMLNGQKLLGVSVAPKEGRSTFTFDLGGVLETWPYGDDQTEEQWIFLTEAEAFSYRADGIYSRHSLTTALDAAQWLPLR